MLCKTAVLACSVVVPSRIVIFVFTVSAVCNPISEFAIVASLIYRKPLSVPVGSVYPVVEATVITVEPAVKGLLVTGSELPVPVGPPKAVNSCHLLSVDVHWKSEP